ncbi:FeoA family protein [Comamonas composti]|uniref:FeoA family protein n=1 Tax=Comamonas composti TaxID=408558 RepID=UPI000A078CD7|nr:FeoA family protein [Comamonas composti]
MHPDHARQGPAQPEGRISDQLPTLNLDALPGATPAHVVGLNEAANAGQQELVLRLMEIGFLPGEPVSIVAAGFPARDPLAVRIGQATFALRRHEAALVRVRPGVFNGEKA